MQDTTIGRQAETIERQADAIAELREDRSRLTAELAAAHEQIASLAAPQQPPCPTHSPDAPAPWWRRWRAWLAAGLVVAVVGSASCQASASTKHAGLCTKARSEMDLMAKDEGAVSVHSVQFWPVANTLVDVASKTC